MEKHSLFDFINCISHDGIVITNLKSYSQYMINLFMSFNKDTLKEACVCNKMGKIPNHMHFKYMYFSIPKEYRRFPYKKGKPKNDTIDFLMDVFDCNYDKAKDLMEILTKEEMRNLRKEFKVVKPKFKQIKKPKTKGRRKL